MGIKERHERERDAVRRAILDAARELFVNEGYENVSLRKIAEGVGIAADDILSFRHFLFEGSVGREPVGTVRGFDQE